LCFGARGYRRRVFEEPWLRWLSRLLVACELLAFPALALGFDKHHRCPLWPDARILLLPAGAAMLGHALLWGTGTLPPFGFLPPWRRLFVAAGAAAMGLAGLAAGLDRIEHHPLFALLALPATLGLALLGAFYALAGSRAVTPAMRGRSRLWRVPRLTGGFVAAIGVLLSLAALGVIPAALDRCGGG
jgi:hypothetical protein